MNDMRRTVDEFSNEAVNQLHEFEEFKYLYYASPPQIELLNNIASQFFSDLFSIFVDRIVLNVCRLTDPAKSCGQENLSIHTLHNRCSNHSAYPKDEAVQLVEQLEGLTSSVKDWRHKIAAHLDLSVATGCAKVKDFVPSDIEEFYKVLQRYLDLIYECLFQDVFPIQIVAQFGAADLVEALQQAYAFQRLLEKEPLHYSEVLLKSKFGQSTPDTVKQHEV
jgi:AbiU2